MIDTTGMTWEELEAAGLDDCGLPLAECPGSPPPGPLSSWKAGRPVEFAFGSRGAGAWTEAHYIAKGMAAPASARVTDDEIRAVLAAIVAHGNSRTHAARALGVSIGTVYLRVRQAQQRGLPTPPPNPRGGGRAGWPGPRLPVGSSS